MQSPISVFTDEKTTWLQYQIFGRLSAVVPWADIRDFFLPLTLQGILSTGLGGDGVLDIPIAYRNEKQKIVLDIRHSTFIVGDIGAGNIANLEIGTALCGSEGGAGILFDGVQQQFSWTGQHGIYQKDEIPQQIDFRTLQHIANIPFDCNFSGFPITTGAVNLLLNVKIGLI
jgi:hypothetical protein